MSIALNYCYKIPDSPVLSGLTCCFPATVGFMRLAFTCPVSPAAFSLKLFQIRLDPWIKALDPRLKGKVLFPLFYFHV